MNMMTKTAERGLLETTTDKKPSEMGDLSQAVVKGQNVMRSGKSLAAFRTISEVADELAVQQHVLRFWETKFSQVKPLKRGGGRRYYRPEDVQLLQSIHRLLYTEGYTIKGVQKLLRDVGKKQLIEGFATPEGAQNLARPLDMAMPQSAPEKAALAAKAGLTEEQRYALRAVLAELKELRGMVKPR
jgi:DNA-binding transcriptional MerR regulator